MSIKTGLIGYGRNGSTMHANPVEAIDGFVMNAVCDIDESARETAAARFACPVYSDYKVMLDEADIDFCIIVTYNSNHAEIAIDCLKAGKNVLVTKPWAVNAIEAKSIIDASEKYNKKLLPWLPTRFGGETKALQSLVDSGKLGKIYSIRRFQHYTGLRSDWQTLKSHGGGYILNWGPHIIDIPPILSGGNVDTVFAMTAQIANPGDAEDVFHALMTTDNGVSLEVEFALNNVPMPRWVLQGDKGSASITDNKLTVYEYKYKGDITEGAYRDDPEIITTITEGIKHPYGDEMVIYKHILDTLNDRSEYEVTPESALGLSKIMDAIRESGQTGKSVNL